MRLGSRQAVPTGSTPEFYSSHGCGKQDWKSLFKRSGPPERHRPAPNGGCQAEHETRWWFLYLDAWSTSSESFLGLSLLSSVKFHDSSWSSVSQSWFHIRSIWGALKVPMPGLSARPLRTRISGEGTHTSMSKPPADSNVQPKVRLLGTMLALF